MDENADQEILKCFVMAMNLWGRTQDIVDLAIEWLNYAFKHEDLNSTLVPVSQLHLSFFYAELNIFILPCGGK